MDRMITIGDHEMPGEFIVGVVVSSLLAVFVIVNLAVLAFVPHTHGTVYSEPYPVTDFELDYATGEGTFTPADTEGKVTVYYFGYTSCPDICPTALLMLRNALNEMPDRLAEQVQVVFISVDPERDTPEMVAQYVSNFNEDFIALHGSMDEVEPVMEIFNAQVFYESEGETRPGAYITHSTAIFVADKEGIVRMRLHHNGDPSYVADDLRYMVRGRIK